MTLWCIKNKLIPFIVGFTLAICPCAWAGDKTANTASRPALSLEYLQVTDYPDDVLYQQVKAFQAFQKKAREPVTGMEFVWVPGGCFNMGSNNGDSDEKPVHDVCLDGFWMGKYEVTQKEWQSIMGNNPSSFKKGDAFPVETVSWNDARAFIKKLNKKTGQTFTLPSEAQWEYAARSGGKTRRYSGGDNIDRFAWYGKNSSGCTHKVGTKTSNDLGIHDMSGNVWEWCQDIYAYNAYKKHRNNNPIYASSGSDRVNRGGGWFMKPANVRCANRNGSTPDNRDNNLGFRLLRTD